MESVCHCLHLCSCKDHKYIKKKKKEERKVRLLTPAKSKWEELRRIGRTAEYELLKCMQLLKILYKELSHEIYFSSVLYFFNWCHFPISAVCCLPSSSWGNISWDKVCLKALWKSANWFGFLNWWQYKLQR